MKLDKAVVDRRVKLLTEEGIAFVTGVTVGKDVREKMAGDFDAVVLATGSTVPRDLGRGRELAGVHFAMEFLVGNAKTSSGRGASISAAGKTWSSWRRHTAPTASERQFARARRASFSWRSCLAAQTAPPTTRGAVAKVYKMDYGQKRPRLWGADPRRYLINTRRLIGDDSGRSAHRDGRDRMGARCERPPEMCECEGTEKVLEADLVLIAMGFVARRPSCRPPSLQAGPRDIVHDDDMMTTLRRLRGGDCSRAVAGRLGHHEGAGRAGVDRFSCSARRSCRAETAVKVPAEAHQRIATRKSDRHRRP